MPDFLKDLSHGEYLMVGSGFADETLSSRAYRLELERGRSWARKLIDGILFFDKDHCKESYESEILRRQMPPSMRE